MTLSAKLQKNQQIRVLLYGLLLGLVCQIYISPFGYSGYVISLGTPALNTLLLLKSKLPAGRLTAVMTFSACLLRGLTGVIGHQMSFGRMFIPALLYYGIYSILLVVSLRFLKKQQKSRMMIAMTVCDFAANLLQLVFLGHTGSESVVYSAAVAVLRGIFVWLLYSMYEWEHLYLRKKEHQSHYAELNSIVSDIYAESFYLKKSMGDLNELMKKSHQLYEDLKDQSEYAGRALDIARETHEIRKDYQRIEQGIHALVREHEEKSMKMSEIFRIIQDNTLRQIEERNQQTELKINCLSDLEIRRYYDLFTILNNLIVNALDACNENGRLSVSAEVRQDMLFLTVSDNGCGIEEDMVPFIWGAGFSTKYDAKSGKMSTGIGLCHVSNVVNHLNGTAEVTSQPGKGTSFSVQIPVKSIS